MLLLLQAAVLPLRCCCLLLWDLCWCPEPWWVCSLTRVADLLSSSASLGQMWCSRHCCESSVYAKSQYTRRNQAVTRIFPPQVNPFCCKHSNPFKLLCLSSHGRIHTEMLHGACPGVWHTTSVYSRHPPLLLFTAAGILDSLLLGSLESKAGRGTSFWGRRPRSTTFASFILENSLEDPRRWLYSPRSASCQV